MQVTAKHRDPMWLETGDLFRQLELILILMFQIARCAVVCAIVAPVGKLENRTSLRKINAVLSKG